MSVEREHLLEDPLFRISCAVVVRLARDWQWVGLRYLQWDERVTYFGRPAIVGDLPPGFMLDVLTGLLHPVEAPVSRDA